MNILILGGTGYVGRILKGILSNKGHNFEGSSTIQLHIIVSTEDKLDNDLNESFFETRTFSHWNDVIIFLKNL